MRNSKLNNITTYVAWAWDDGIDAASPSLLSSISEAIKNTPVFANVSVEEFKQHYHNIDASLLCSCLLQCQVTNHPLQPLCSHRGYKLVEWNAVCKPPLVLLLKCSNQVINYVLPVTINCFKLEWNNIYKLTPHWSPKACVVSLVDSHL